MKLLQSPLFKKNYKKLHPNQKNSVKEEIKKIVANPLIGEEKKQDLKGVYVHKFKINSQLYLLAYTFDPITLTLLMLGVHENFYRDLKNNIY